MELTGLIIGAIVGLLVGGLLAWLVRGQGAAREIAEIQRQHGALIDELRTKDEARTGEFHRREAAAERVPALEQQALILQDRLAVESERSARLETTLEKEREAIAEQKALLADAQQLLGDAFKALAADALKQNNSSFLQLAGENFGRAQVAAQGELERRRQAIDELVKPLRDQLTRYEKQVQELEGKREKAYGELLREVKILDDNQRLVSRETGRLVQALRAPKTRGRWGENTLRRVVELAGMIEHCDFNLQVSAETEAGRLQPDMVIRLPGGGAIVVDAKTPLEAYLDAIEASEPEAQTAALERHAQQVQNHLESLSKKTYWAQFHPAPDYVVMFIPGESFLSAAAERRPDLFEYGLDRKVILASPTFLVALLQTASLIWRQKQMAENAVAIEDAARELYNRLTTMVGHLTRLGRSLAGGIEAYNQLIGSLEGSVLPQARRIPALGVKPKNLLPETLETIQTDVRPLTAPELAPPSGDLFANESE